MKDYPFLRIQNVQPGSLLIINILHPDIGIKLETLYKERLQVGKDYFEIPFHEEFCEFKVGILISNSIYHRISWNWSPSEAAIKFERGWVRISQIPYA